MLLKYVTLSLLLCVGLVAYDWWQREQKRLPLGRGVRWHCDAPFYVTTKSLSHLERLRQNDKLTFSIKNTALAGQVYAAGSLPPGSELHAEVVSVSYSETLKRKVVYFQFFALKIAGKSYPFLGYFGSAESSAREKAELLGSLALTSYGGGVGSIVGFFLGPSAIESFRERFESAPINFVVGDINDSVELTVLSFNSGFLPFDLNPTGERRAATSAAAARRSPKNKSLAVVKERSFKNNGK